MAKTVRVIPAKPKVVLEKDKKKGRLRVAAYCRVSTDDEEQLTSYHNQIDYYTEKINSNPDWEMAGIFADEGITGTSTKRRKEFQNLMALCRRGRVDLILTKSVSRFARNTVDCLNYARRLKDKGIGILFEKEGVNTLELAGELMLAFHGGFAQAESESISVNVAHGHRMAMKAGHVNFQYKRLYGYRRGEDNTPEIITEEAVIVRRIYYSMLSGYSAARIRDSLKADGIKPPRGAEHWTPAAILRILQNEIYAGDVLRQKTYISDCISKTVKKNTGELPQYYIMDNHPAIVPREVYNRVQEEFARRNSQVSLSTKPSKTNKGKFSSKYALTELMRCGECGAAYRRVTWPAKTNGGEKRIVWRCVSRLEQGKSICHNSPTIPEPILHTAILDAIRLLKMDTNDAKTDVREVLTAVIQHPGRETAEKLDAMIQRSEDEMITLMMASTNADIPGEAYHAQFQLLSNNISQLRLRREELARRAQADGNAEHRMVEVMELLYGGTLDSDTYDDVLTRKLVESITVVSQGKLKIVFRNGAAILADIN